MEYSTKLLKVYRNYLKGYIVASKMFNTGIISKNRKYFYTCFLSYESQYIFGNVIVLLKSWGKQSFL